MIFKMFRHRQYWMDFSAWLYFKPSLFFTRCGRCCETWALFCGGRTMSSYIFLGACKILNPFSSPGTRHCHVLTFWFRALLIVKGNSLFQGGCLPFKLSGLNISGWKITSVVVSWYCQWKGVFYSGLSIAINRILFVILHFFSRFPIHNLVISRLRIRWVLLSKQFLNSSILNIFGFQ